MASADLDTSSFVSRVVNFFVKHEGKEVQKTRLKTAWKRQKSDEKCAIIREGQCRPHQKIELGSERWHEHRKIRHKFIVNSKKIRKKPCFNINEHFSDLRTKSWFLTNNPTPILTILATYLYFCLYAGPRYMKNRKPFQLKNTLIVYNIVQVVLSIILVIEVSFLLLGEGMTAKKMVVMWRWFHWESFSKRHSL
jgi:hypothetical protein